MKCEICQEEGAKKQRQNTAYQDDEKNYAVLCDRCQKEVTEHWQEMWDDYNSGRL